MRSGLVAGLMGVGGIFVSFGAVIVVLALFARHDNMRTELPAMTTLATLSIVVGGVMFAAGYLLGRMGRSASDSTRADRSAASPLIVFEASSHLTDPPRKYDSFAM
jgi:hypothetical protein